MAKRTIFGNGQFMQDEAVANEALSPGHVIEVLSTGKVQKQSTEGADAERAVAFEDALQGRAVETAYDSGDPVTYGLLVPGSRANVMLEAGYAYTKGMSLILSGNGCLIPEAAASSAAAQAKVFAVMMETLDLSDESNEVDTLAEVRIV